MRMREFLIAGAVMYMAYLIMQGQTPKCRKCFSSVPGVTQDSSKPVQLFGDNVLQGRPKQLGGDYAGTGDKTEDVTAGSIEQYYSNMSNF